MNTDKLIDEMSTFKFDENPYQGRSQEAIYALAVEDCIELLKVYIEREKEAK
jgi:hypothetical protein